MQSADSGKTMRGQELERDRIVQDGDRVLVDDALRQRREVVRKVGLMRGATGAVRRGVGEVLLAILLVRAQCRDDRRRGAGERAPEISVCMRWTRWPRESASE